MILETMSQLAGSVPVNEAAAKTGAAIASSVANWLAPIAAILIGCVGLKYLFGDTRSMSGFIGFLVLGVFVYALIKWNNAIVSPLGEVFKGWLSS